MAFMISGSNRARPRAHGNATKRPRRLGYSMYGGLFGRVALFLGHDWNQMPDTMLYDHVRDDEYVATMTFPG